MHNRDQGLSEGNKSTKCPCDRYDHPVTAITLPLSSPHMLRAFAHALRDQIDQAFNQHSCVLWHPSEWLANLLENRYDAEILNPDTMSGRLKLRTLGIHFVVGGCVSHDSKPQINIWLFDLKIHQIIWRFTKRTEDLAELLTSVQPCLPNLLSSMGINLFSFGIEEFITRDAYRSHEETIGLDHQPTPQSP